MEAQRQLQSLLPLLAADAELLPHPVESRQGVTGRARGAAQRLAEDDGRLQELAPVVVRALEGQTGSAVRTVSLLHTSSHMGVSKHDSATFKVGVVEGYGKVHPQMD